jgi:DNA (cytosine-5)-methyltransferase 1
VFVVGCLGDWESAAKVLFESDCLSGDNKKSRTKRQATTTYSERGVAYGGSDGECADTVTSKWAKGSGGPSGNECGLFVAHKVYETHPADSRVKEMGEVCQTVTSRWGTGGGNVPLVQAIGCDTYNGLITGQTACTMTADMAGPTHSGPKVLVQAYSIREDAKANNFSATPLSVTPALQAMQPSVQSHHAQTFIAQGFDSYNLNLTGDVNQTIKSPNGGVLESVGGVLSNMAVRRLTPRECERLQGFKDDYTIIPWKKGESPDGHRYKALGNSMAVPVMKWIGERINEINKQI